MLLAALQPLSPELGDQVRGRVRGRGRVRVRGRVRANPHLVHEADAHDARGRELEGAVARAEQPSGAARVGAAAAHLLAHHDVAHVLAPHRRVVPLNARHLVRVRIRVRVRNRVKA